MDAPQAVPVEACHCPSEDNKFQEDQKKMGAEEFSGECRAAAGHSTVSLLAQEKLRRQADTRRQRWDRVLET